MEKTQQLIQNLELELKEYFPRLYYKKRELLCKDTPDAVGLGLRIMGPFCRYMLIDADIACSEENVCLNQIVLFSKHDKDAQSLFEKTKQFYYKNDIPFEAH